jgi:exportin-2 (importin alpha re-exporter)
LFKKFIKKKFNLKKKKSDEAGLLEQIKSQICDNISLFAQNYSEDFADYLPKFVTEVWNLLITTSLESKYDLVRKKLDEKKNS